MRLTFWLTLYLACAFFATLWLYNHAMDRRGTADLRQVLSHVSPYRWSLDSAEELSTHGRWDIRGLQFTDGAALFESVGDDPHFWLTSDKLLDLRGYPLLSLAIHAEREDRLQIHLSCATHPLFVATHALPPVELTSGINHLLIPVDPKKISSFGSGPCPAAAFDSLRIDPGMTPENRFVLDHVELMPTTRPSDSAPPMRIDFREAIQLEELPHFTESGHHLIVENVSTLASPEWNRARAESLYRRNPSVILFSGALPDQAKEMIDGSRSAQPRPPVDRGKVGWLSSLMLLSLTGALLAIAGLSKAQRMLGHNRMIVRRLLERPRIQLALVITASLLAFQIIPYSVTSLPLLALDAIAFLTLITLLLFRDAPPTPPANHWSWLPRSIGAWQDTALWTLVLAGALLILATIAPPPTWPDPGPLAIHAARYTLWALLQQLILGPLLIDRIYALNGNRSASIVAGALIFSAFHFPNFALTCVTLVAGLIWGRLYLRYRALLPLAISHGVLGSLFEHLLPEYLRWGGKVGVGYFQAMGF